MKYRKKPIVIDAWRNEGTTAYPAWVVSNTSVQTYTDGHIIINTLEGQMRADVGDWIIKGVKGEIYPCKPDIFDATYEAVE